ncbi:5'-3' exoribonuclease 2 [Magnaporthiopsis poae ATCC 64411]|uniref:5'-3' exoribonuclease n=1 Tax=Magnaporthiopsis poae (strain ATCC 64411 / 73-15) TaxID=644358 RepID=A0A0C4DRC9_MAGP6|nr:5'-3' exoribonuclease 2 [Magnaporthiopsis poae ATCC 64411]
MGIPAAFRWLSTKYPKIISPVIEDKPIEMDDGTVIPVDATKPNPNGEEFDNLYLDMNGIVHPCAHPEDRPAPKDEEEMMLEIFRYTDRVVNMVRPRKVLMIAVDGVAPRAKMNQQRSRRFRSAQEAKEKAEDKMELLKLLKQQKGGDVAPETLESVTKKAFDTNSITPGTPFMLILAASLRYWCAYKLNTDPAWANLKIIISDATVPGEGEHKIMDFVRSQRSSPDHDPNTRHVIYGLDADLIMLGLATHEPHFRVLREDVFFQQGQARMCKLCGQKGHDAQNCRGEVKEKVGEFDEKEKAEPLKPFIWLHVSVLREYLAVELEVSNLPFRFDLERAVDDWIFLCCFVGNDFLPHLPALEIRENGINTLTSIWKRNLAAMGGYVTKDGHIDLNRIQVIMRGLAQQEDSIFRKRKETEDRKEANAKRRKLQDDREKYGKKGSQGKQNESFGGIAEPGKLITHDMVVNRAAAQAQDANVANKSAASILKSQIKALSAQAAEATPPETPVKNAGDSEDSKPDTPASETPASALGKRKADLLEDGDSSTGPNSPAPGTPSAGAAEGPVDTVRMWEEGYSDRYYEQKFHADPKDIGFRHKVAHAYVEGLAWVLLYYFQGCPSWEWYYPYHYAPFAADFEGLADLKISFEKGRTSRPYEQLMSVLPAASRDNLPAVFHDLMMNEDSEIIDFYPEDFEVDLNGKKFAWQGVVLLPFIEMDRLLAAVQAKYPLLTPEEAARNGVGKDVLLLSDAHEGLYDDIITHFYSKRQSGSEFTLNQRNSDLLAGKVAKLDDYLPHGALVYPLERKSMPDVEYDRSLSVHYEMPKAHAHKSMLLRGVKMPTPALTQSDQEELRGKLRGRHNGGGYGGRGGYGNGNGGGYGNRGGYGNGYGNGNSHGSRDYRGDRQGGPPQHRDQSWRPPAPGQAGFGVGALPPPPPPGHHYGGHGQGHNNQYPPAYSQGYQQYPSAYPPAGASAYPPSYPPQSYGGYPQHGQYQTPPPHGGQRGSYNRHEGGGGGRDYGSYNGGGGGGRGRDNRNGRRY